MEFRILGPLEVELEGEAVVFQGLRQRRLLGALLLEADRIVPEERLAEIVWHGEDLPDAAVRTMRTYVTRLRQSLGGGEFIVNRDAGYVLATDGHQLDRRTFEDRLASARRTPDPAGRADQLTAAVELWRGPLLGDLSDEPWVRAESNRLDELRAAAVEDRAEAKLELGLDGEVISDLETHLDAWPRREKLRALHMMALYRSGREADALRSFQAHRERLADETGLEPGEELAELERRIISREESLSVSPGASTRGLRGYRLGEVIGEGAFSLVYRGTQPSVGREVAVKQIRAELANRPEFIRRFEAEAQMVARLEHPYIVPLYDYWREPDTAYLVMRWLRGGTLEDQLLHRRLEVTECDRLVHQVGSALAVAHRAGVVHRDVKPANVFLDGEGNFYLGDFGIALDSAGVSDPSSALSAGSPAYASPEQLRREPVGPTADVHGLAIAVFEALTGRLPFPAEATQAALLERQLHDPIPLIRDVRTDVPAALDTIVQQATAKSPEDRYQSVEELVDAFERALEGGTTRSSRGSSTLVVTGERSNPYLGLRAFQQADADRFFGRDRLVDELAAALRADGSASRLVTVVGPSGSGKSSVVRAGLLPALRTGAVPGSEDWFVTAMVPGEAPFEELETALLRVAINPPEQLLGQLTKDVRGVNRAVKRILPGRDTELLLVIDQFEELFTLCDDASVRRRFLEGLAAAVSDPGSQLRVVFTLRADFYDRPLRHAEIASLVKASTVTVAPLAPDELEQAIVEPAHSVGCEFEPGLVSEIAADVADQPGALPLLQYALTELWEQQVSGLLTRDAYHQLGGVAGALTRRAEDLYQEATAEEQAAIRPLFGRLVTPGEGTEDTRRRAHRTEVATTTPTETVIDTYGQARLLSFDTDPATREPTVEVAHEALIRQWPRLRQWLDEDREGLGTLRRLHAAASGWEESGGDDSELYRGGRLEAAEEFAAGRPDELTDLERSFLQASSEGRDRERQLERRRLRRLRGLLAAAAVVGAIAVIAGLVAFQQESRADDEAREAEALAEAALVAEEEARTQADRAETGRLAGTAGLLAPDQRQLGLLLAVEAYDRSPDAETLGALQRALLGSGSLKGVLGAGERVDRSYWLDGDRILGAGPSGVKIFEVETGAATILSDDAVSVRMSANVQYIPQQHSVFTYREGIAAFTTADVPNEVTVMAVPSGQILSRVALDTEPPESLEISPDGSVVAAMDSTGQLTLIELDTGSVRWSTAAVPEVLFRDFELPDGVEVSWSLPDQNVHTWVLPIRFTPDSRTVTAYTAETRAFDVDSGDIVLKAPTALISLQVIPSADGNRYLTYSGSAVAVNDAATHEPISGGRLEGTANSSGGAVIAWAAWDGVSPSAHALLDNGLLVHFSLEDGTAIDTPIQVGLVGAGHIAISPDARTATVNSVDGLYVFALDGARPMARAIPANGSFGGGISVDGSLVVQNIPTVAGLAEGEDELYEPNTGAFIDGFSAPGKVLSLSVGAEALIAQQAFFQERRLDQEVQAFDTGTLQPLGPIVTIDSGLVASALSADSRLMAITTFFDGVHVFDVGTGERVAEPEEVGNRAASPSFNPDGTRLAVTDNIGRPSIWNTEDWTLVSDSLPDTADGVASVRYTPDGRYLITMNKEGRISLRDPGSFEVLRSFHTPGRRATDGLIAIDGSSRYILALTGPTVTMWDLEQGVQIGEAFPNDPTNKIGIQDGIDHPQLVTAEGTSRLIWNLDVSTWRDLACEIAGRNLTETEWDEFGPRDEPYGVTCQNWPLPN